MSAAQEMLAKIGVPMEVTRLGVTRSEAKRFALERKGAIVFPALVEALAYWGVLPE